MIPTGLKIPVMSAPPLKGRKWIAGAAAGEGKGLSVILNREEPLALDLLPKNSVVFDVGANVGLYTLLLAKQVYSFEPVPRNIEYLSRHIRINKISNVTIVPCAISDQTNLFAFEYGDNCVLGHISDAGNQPVVAISCDTFCDQFSCTPNLIKIDVEGAEISVLQGAKYILIKHKPVVFLSTHSDDLRKNCLEIMQEFGYNNISPINSENIDTASEFLIRS